MGFKTGEKVINAHGLIGTVGRQYDDFSACALSLKTMTGQQWLEKQTIPFSPDQLKENWYLIFCDSGGSIWSCESQLSTLNAKEQKIAEIIMTKPIHDHIRMPLCFFCHSAMTYGADISVKTPKGIGLKKTFICHQCLKFYFGISS